MRMLLSVLLCVPIMASAQSWVEGSIVGVPADNGKDALVLYLWGNGLDPHVNVPQQALPAGQWHTVTMSANLPPDVKAVELSGLVGTSGLSGYYCGMVANFRTPGSTLNEWNYQVQAVAGLPGAAFRQNLTITVPVKNRQFEFFWHQPHSECSLFLSLGVHKYIR